ncbi:alkaline phosphatase PafA [Aquimarina agarilytica]|uniref:alkaline phosphatase PafA n=1 Tax=Aquimarina agarilytica TaxID=1087449 RepID=UPI0002891E78|nr:alkaline phosphatase PafA [Aquimarina agarilytica]
MCFFVLASFLVSSLWAQKPKLVVGIVVDQMRFDYLTRFEKRYSENGFKRLINEGFECKNHHYNYMPTYTGPGHASIFTGTSPNNHGIIANNWYDKFEDKEVYCAGDQKVKALGTESIKEKMSPRRMLTTTFADQNRLHTQFRGKTIGVSIKDRGAILPAGHTANGAYWFRGKEEGQWVSSTFYGNKLPDWVVDFNERDAVKKQMQSWNTLYPINTYTASGPDDTNFENGYKGKEKTVFPYDLKKLAKKNNGFDILKVSPFGNTLVTDFAIKAIEKELLGQDTYTDVITISYSSPDYIGHNFGVNSVEIEDTYLRLDLELGRLFKELDKKVGKDNYTIFLTADHGAVHVPSYLKRHKIAAGYFDEASFKAEVVNFLKSTFNENGLVKKIMNQQVYLNYELIREKKLSLEKITNELAHFIRQQKHMQYVFTRSQLESEGMTSYIGRLIQNGFHQRLSGDVVYVLAPSIISYGKKGSTHGSPQSYDTHVPLLFYGKGIKQGKTYKKTSVTDITPTISALLGIGMPNGVTGNVLDFVLE